MSPNVEIEARRQQALLMSLQARPAENDAPGLRAYRANADASAKRALGTNCPTVQALMGAENFAQIARRFWRAHPPQRGDLGEWGGEFPSWIDAQESLRDWPYLGDCARLDLSLYRCEHAADATFDAASFDLLASADPSHLQLRLMPGVQSLISRWPLASIHAAHAAADDALFEVARAALHAKRGEAVVVFRAGWRADLRQVNTSSAVFVQTLGEPCSLQKALDTAPTGFDFSTWLADALRHNWVKELCLLNNSP